SGRGGRPTGPHAVSPKRAVAANDPPALPQVFDGASAGGQPSGTRRAVAGERRVHRSPSNPGSGRGISHDLWRDRPVKNSLRGHREHKGQKEIPGALFSIPCSPLCSLCPLWLFFAFPIPDGCFFAVEPEGQALGTTPRLDEFVQLHVHRL